MQKGRLGEAGRQGGKESHFHHINFGDTAGLSDTDVPPMERQLPEAAKQAGEGMFSADLLARRKHQRNNHPITCGYGW